MGRFNVNEAYPGFCSLCHDEIAEFDGFIEAKPGVMRLKIVKLKPNFRMVNIELSDGTLMTVSLCDKCENFPPERAGELMESEINGWKRECDELIGDWETIVRDGYLERQSKLHLVDRLDRRWNDDDRTKITKPEKKNLRLPEKILEKVR